MHACVCPEGCADVLNDLVAGKRQFLRGRYASVGAQTASARNECGMARRGRAKTGKQTDESQNLNAEKKLASDIAFCVRANLGCKRWARNNCFAQFQGQEHALIESRRALRKLSSELQDFHIAFMLTQEEPA